LKGITQVGLHVETGIKAYPTSTIARFYLSGRFGLFGEVRFMARNASKVRDFLE
jgi:hypothetical protein